MLKRYILVLISTFCLYSCASEPSEPLPNTPETVVKAYQKYLDENDFKAAKKLSTKDERQRLDMIAQMLEDEPLDSTLMNTTFLKLDCKATTESATCYYTIKEFGELFSDSFLLVNQRGQWLVDVIEEEFTIESDTLFEDVIQMLNEEQNLIVQ